MRAYDSIQTVAFTINMAYDPLQILNYYVNENKNPL